MTDEASGKIRSARRHGELIASARAVQMEPVEFQLDFDCAQKKLSGYARVGLRRCDLIQPVSHWSSPRSLFAR